MFDKNRPCSSNSRKKDRYTKKELVDLSYKYKITLPRDNMTITELCSYYNSLNWEQLKNKRQTLQKNRQKNIIQNKKKKIIRDDKIKRANIQRRKIDLKVRERNKEKYAENKRKRQQYWKNVDRQIDERRMRKQIESKNVNEKDMKQKNMKQNKIQGNCITRSRVNLKQHQLNVINYMGKSQNRLLVYHKMGSGKTLTAVTVSQCYLDNYPNGKVVVITPASLTDNFKKEMEKYGNIRNANKYEFYSIQKATNLLKENKLSCSNKLVIIDEVHNYRTNIKIAKKNNKIVSGVNVFNGYKCFLKAHQLLLLTGTPLYNNPDDLTIYKVLLNYNEDFIKNMSIEEIVKHYQEYPIESLENKVNYYYNNYDENFPTRIDTIKQVEMSNEYETQYLQILEEIEKQNPNLLYNVFRNYTDANKNQFENLTRRATQNIDNNLKLNLKLGKIIRIINRLKTQNEKENLPNNQKMKLIIYSNFKEHGIELLKEKTTVPFSTISGDTKVSMRQKIVNSFNEGTIQVLYITKAGGEGLDLKGATGIIIMEPTWNTNNAEQIIARAIRYKSHSHLPPNRRYVKVVQYLHLLPEEMNYEEIEEIKNYLEDDSTDMPRIPSFIKSCDLSMYIYQIRKQKTLDILDDKLKSLSF